MKRFITYLYEYERKRKGKNTGFIKVDVRGAETSIEVFVRNYMRTPETGAIYAFVKENRMVGIHIGEIQAKDGQGDAKIRLSTLQISDSRFSVQDIAGIGIIFKDSAYLASCWKEEYAEEISAGEFGVWESSSIKENLLKEKVEQVEAEVSPQMEAAEVLSMEATISDAVNFQSEEDASSERATYQKIELDEIHSLPSPNWHLCNNSFLVHGFWNYGYLVLKKETKENSESIFLGVPGIFEKPEMVMAVVFGFTEFQTIPQEVVNANINEEKTTPFIEKNQEPKTGEFGCWFVKLQK